MKNKYLISILTIIFSTVIVSSASALTFVNRYNNKSAEIKINPVSDGTSCNENEEIYFKLYVKQNDGPTPSITFLKQDFEGVAFNTDKFCISTTHPTDRDYDYVWELFGKVVNSNDCELFITGTHTIEPGPGCTVE